MRNRCFFKFFESAIVLVLMATALGPAHSDNDESVQARVVPKASVAAATCADATTRCVGAGQEYSTIQAAATDAQAGDAVLVFDGNYTGFQVTRSGTRLTPIVFKSASGGAVIDTPINLSGDNDGVFLSNVSYVTIEGFKIENMPMRCIAARNGSPTAPMKGIVIRNVSCTNAGHEGFYLSEVSESFIENNTVIGSGANGQDRGHGIYLANAGSDNTTLRGNRISGMQAADSAGIHFNGDASVGGDGLISGLVVEGNTISAGPQNGLNMDGVQDSLIQNNLIYGMNSNALRAYQIDATAGPKNLKIVNNTFIVPSSSSGWAIKLTEDGGGHVIFNNVLIPEGSGGGSLCVDNVAVTSDHNAVVDRFSRNGDATTISLASWGSGGDDAASFLATATALFVNAGASDYHLKTGSAAIDAGISSLADVQAPAADLSGVPRPQGVRLDMGAYESGSDITRPTPPRNLRTR